MHRWWIAPRRMRRGMAVAAPVIGVLLPREPIISAVLTFRPPTPQLLPVAASPAALSAQTGAWSAAVAAMDGVIRPGGAICRQADGAPICAAQQAPDPASKPAAPDAFLAAPNWEAR